MSGIFRPVTACRDALFAEGVWRRSIAPSWAHAIGNTRTANKAFVNRTPASNRVEYGSAEVQNQGAARSDKIATRAFFILFSPDRSRRLCVYDRFLPTNFHAPVAVHATSDPKRNHCPTERETREPTHARSGT